jgi:O-antigen/teichoic acid export membrane protein
MRVKEITSLLRDKKKQDFFIYGTGQAFNLISPLLVVPYIVSVCGEEGLGKVGLGFAMALFLILIVDYAFEIKGPKEVSENRDNHWYLQKIANTTFFSKFILFIAVVILAGIVIYSVPFFYNEKELLFFSLAVVLAQVFNPAWFLQGIENFRLVSLLNVGSKITYMLLVYFLVTGKDDYKLVNLLLGISTLVFNAGGLIFIKYKYAIKAIRPDIKELTALLKADFSFCVSQLFLSARQLSPLLIAGYFLGFYAAGQYKIIEQVTSMFRTFIQVYLRFFYPSVCYKASKNPADGFAFWKKYSVFSLGIIFLILIIMYAFSTQLLQFFNASPDTIVALDKIFRISLALPLFMAMSLPLEQLMFVVNKNTAYVRITITVTTITILLILLVINTYGILGIIVSLLFSELLFIALYFIYSYLFLQRQVHENDNLKT